MRKRRGGLTEEQSMNGTEEHPEGDSRHRVRSRVLHLVGPILAAVMAGVLGGFVGHHLGADNEGAEARQQLTAELRSAETSKSVLATQSPFFVQMDYGLASLEQSVYDVNPSRVWVNQQLGRLHQLRVINEHEQVNVAEKIAVLEHEIALLQRRIRTTR